MSWEELTAIAEEAANAMRKAGITGDMLAPTLPPLRAFATARVVDARPGEIEVICALAFAELNRESRESREPRVLQ